MADNSDICKTFRKRPIKLNKDDEIDSKNMERILGHYDSNFKELEQRLAAQPHVPAADGTLEDATTKLNTLITQLEYLGLFQKS